MSKIIDLSSRSDKLLFALGYQLSEASVNIYQAVLVWQELVELEAQRDRAIKYYAELETIPEGQKARMHDLQDACVTTACELKDIYNAIKAKLPSVPETLSIPIQRLEKDYGEVFKARGL